MSIADKITSIENHLKDDYQSIANLGADLTNVDKNIENISSLLDGVYDVLPKTSFQEGTEVTIEGGLKGKIDFDDGKVGYGQASQESTQGYQLISLKDGTYTGNSGVTIKVENGKCTINGTPSASEVIPVQLKDNLSLTNGQTYTLYGFNDAANSNVAFRPRIDEGFFQVAFGTTNNVESKTYNGTSISVAYIGIRVGSGTTITNLVCKPMLISGNDTTKSYEQYSGGYASPSPNWEQEIKCVAGRNKLPTYEIKKFTASADAWCSLDGISNFYNQTNIAPSKVFCNLKANQTYTISVYQKANTNNVQLVDYTGAVLLTGLETQAKQYTPSTDIKVYPRLKVTSSNTETYCYIQLEQGSTAHPYLPYNTIQETIRGKNYLPNVETQTNVGVTIDYTNAIISINGTSTGSGSISMQEETLQAGTYTMCSKYISGSVNNAVQYIFKKKGASSNIGSFVWNDTNYQNNQKLTFTLDEETILETSIWIGGTSRVYTSFKTNVQLVKGTERDDNYEPYHTPRTYQFSLGDHKFYAIGDYKDYIWTDRSTKKWYIHKVINKVVFTGASSESWEFQSTYTGFFTHSYAVATGYSPAKSNYFINSEDTVWVDERFGFNSNGATLWIRDTSNFSSLSDFTTWLATHNLEIYYALATLTETEITGTLAEQLEEWWNGQSLDGTTIIESNGDLPMIIKVRALKGES